MAKVINLQSEEEITSVVERLWETGEEEIFLVAPQGSALLKNIIGLKLLKREAERLGKEITLITKDEVGREMAKRVGLSSRVLLPKKREIKDEAEEKTFKEMPSRDFEAMIEEEVKSRRKSIIHGLPISDIRVKKQLVREEDILPEEKKDILSDEQGSSSIFDELPEKNKKKDYLPDSFSFAKLKEDFKNESIISDEEEPKEETSEFSEELSFPIRMMAKEQERIEHEEKKGKSWWKKIFSGPKEMAMHLKVPHLKKHFVFSVFIHSVSRFSAVHRTPA